MRNVSINSYYNNKKHGSITKVHGARDELGEVIVYFAKPFAQMCTFTVNKGSDSSTGCVTRSTAILQLKDH